MAEEAAKKKPEGGEKPAGGEKATAKGGGGIGALLNKTPVMLGAVMILEAVVLFAGFKFLGSGPQPVAGVELIVKEPHGEHGAEGEAASTEARKQVEINVVDFKAPNKISGRTLLVDVSIWMVVKADFEERAKETVKAREALIRDRIRTIIAQSDPSKLDGEAEPGLETLRRQVKYQLDEIIGEGIVEEVLVPRCIPLRTD